jgi:hypothetical protein
VIANAVFATTVIFLALAFYIAEECSFLAPWRDQIFRMYGMTIAGYASLLFLNLLAIVFSVSRRFFLKDTGRKLAHLEHQLRSGQSISEELSRRIEGDE